MLKDIGNILTLFSFKVNYIVLSCEGRKNELRIDILVMAFLYNIIRAANNHLIFRSYFKSDLHLLMFLRDFVLAILIKISYRALFFRRCPLPCKIFFSIQIFLQGTGHLQKKRAQLKSSKYFCWALFFWRCPRALFFWRCPVKIFEYWKIIWEYKMMPMGIFQKMHRFFNQKRALYRKIICWPYNTNQKETCARGLFKLCALITQEECIFWSK